MNQAVKISRAHTRTLNAAVRYEQVPVGQRKARLWDAYENAERKFDEAVAKAVS